MHKSILVEKSRAAKLIVGLALATLALAQVGASSAFATSFQVSPTRFEFSLTKRFTNFFTVTNNSDQTLRIRVYPRFIEVSDDNKIVEKVGHPHDLSRWMVFNPRLLSIRSGRRRTVRFSVRPPGKLEAGEYRAVVFFEELPASAKDKSPEKQQQDVSLQIKLLTRLGVTIYGMVGERRKQVVVAEPPKVNSEKRLVVLMTLENKGNFHLQIKMKAVLRRESGETVHESETLLLLHRGRQRQWKFETDRPEPGRYELAAVVTSKDEELLEFTVPISIATP